MKTAIAPEMLTIIGREKLGLDESYRYSGFKRLSEGLFVIYMTVVTGVKNNSIQWDVDSTETVRVTMEELEERERKWERETGLCVDCGGDGITNIGWSKDTGIKYGPCKRCNKTGKPIQKGGAE